jgi:hypothetical protein
VIEALDALGMAGERGAPGIATNSALRGWCLLLLLGSQIWPSDLSWLSDGSAEAGCWLGGQRLMRTGVSADASAQALGNLLDLLSRALDDWLDGDQEAWCAVPAPLVAAAAEFSRRAISTSQILGPAGANQALLGLLAVALTDLAESQAALSAEIARAAIIAVAAGSPVLIAAAAGATRQGCA